MFVRPCLKMHLPRRERKKTRLRFCRLELANCRVWWLPTGGKLQEMLLTFKVYKSNMSVQSGTQKAFLRKQQLIRQQGFRRYTTIVIIIQASSAAKKEKDPESMFNCNYLPSTCIYKQIQTVRCPTLCPMKWFKQILMFLLCHQLSK